MKPEYENQQDLIQSIERMIDNASMRQCYERHDAAIHRFVVVSPDHSLAEVAAHLMAGAPDPRCLDQLIAEGKVDAMLPDVRVLLKALIDPARMSPQDRQLKGYLEPRIDLEVEAFYCPPLYFVRFTGDRWQ